MKSALDIIQRHLAGARVAVAVSGGVDSMCLAHLLRNSGVTSQLDTVHINHSIRPNADDDAQFVRTHCGTNLLLFVVNAPEYAATHGVSLELAGRTLRRQIWARLCSDEFGFDFVALAHHAQDQAETVLYRLFRGTGLGGLAGMRVLGPDRLIRPLLGVSRDQILDYATTHNIPFVTDQSNADQSMDRNYIRHSILPLIAARWNIQRSTAHLADLADQTQRWVDDQLDDQLLTLDEHGASISLQCLAHSVPASAYLARVWSHLGISDSVDRNIYQRVLELGAKSPGKRVQLGDGWLAIRCCDCVDFVRQVPADDRVIPFCVGTIQLGDWQVTVSATPPQHSTGVVLRFDPGAVPAGAVWRTRRPGDIFTPFGGGTRTLQRWLIDRHIPSHQRPHLPLLAEGSRICAIAGVQISEQLRVTGPQHYISVRHNSPNSAR